MNHSLIEMIQQTTLPTTRFQRGYSQVQVDAFLSELCAALEQGRPVREMIGSAIFSPTHLKVGYQEDPVDELLTRVEQSASA